LKTPEAGGNSMNWVLGHIVAVRNGALRNLGAEPPWTDAEAAPYVRGSLPLNPKEALPFEKIRKDFDLSQERLLAALQSLPVGVVEESVANPMPTKNLAILHLHDAYHAGQLGILRRTLGKPGAIK